MKETKKKGNFQSFSFVYSDEVNLHFYQGSSLKSARKISKSQGMATPRPLSPTRGSHHPLSGLLGLGGGNNTANANDGNNHNNNNNGGKSGARVIPLLLTKWKLLSTSFDDLRRELPEDGTLLFMVNLFTRL